jgi:2-polyprenyl-3-methyl-5-hydroxy-6-metoxy-1,4-benzoquinol methylase
MKTEIIKCPFCGDSKNKKWAVNNGFVVVKCDSCGFLYVNPRPAETAVKKAVISGVHSVEANSINVINQRVAGKIESYRAIFEEMFSDVFEKNLKISWLDIGAGYGEIVEAVGLLAPDGSIVMGVEPMEPKASDAKRRGINVKHGYLNSVSERFSYISLVNVFSHIPDFRSFLNEIKSKLLPKGEIFIETGNAADLQPGEVPGDLSLPDHLVFSGEKHIKWFLVEQGFEIVSITRVRYDTVWQFCKDLIKKMLGRKINLVLPYTSPYRSLLIRARLN